MSGSKRRTTETLLVLTLATGTLLAVGCVTKPDGKDERAVTNVPEVSSPGTTEHADAKKKPARPPALSPIARVAEMADEDIAARTGEINDQIEKEKKQHRKRLEPFFDTLKAASLREPDYKAVSRANDLERLVYAGWKPEEVRGYAGNFRRETTKEHVETIAMGIEKHIDKVNALIAEKPNEIVARRWGVIVKEANESIGAATDLLAKSKRAPSLETNSRAAITEAIGALARVDQECRAGVEEVRVVLLDSRAKLTIFQKQARHFPGFKKGAEEAFPVIDESLAELRDLKATDHSAVFAYHRRFAAGLPASLADIASLSAFGKAVRKDSIESPEMWKLAALRSLYPRCQVTAYSEVVAQGGLRGRVKAAADAHHRAYDRWRAAALKIAPAEAENLLTFLTKNVLDDAKVDASRVSVLKAIVEEHGIPALPKSSLVPTNPRRLVKHLSPLKAEAERYHVELVRKLSANREIADIASITNTVRRGARGMFSEKAVRFYAAWQGEQWLEYALSHFGDNVRNAAADYRWWDAASSETWTEHAKQIDPALVKRVLGFLSSEVLDPQVFLWQDRWGEYRGMVMSKGLPLRPVDLDFWLDVADVHEIDTAGLTRPGPDGGAGLLRDVRSYHAVLKKRLEGVDGFAALGALRTAIAGDREANPNHWTKRELANEYADLMARRFYAMFKQTLEPKALKAKTYYRSRRVHPEWWAKACRTFTQPEVDAVIGFLQGRAIDQRAFDGRLRHLIGFHQSKLEVTSLKFWQEVGKAVGASTDE